MIESVLAVSVAVLIMTIIIFKRVTKELGLEREPNIVNRSISKPYAKPGKYKTPKINDDNKAFEIEHERQ